MGRRARSVRSSRLKNEQGFTLVELIVALALLGTLLVVVWGAASGGLGAVARISGSIRRSVELVQIDAAVRGFVDRIDVPYWRNEAKVEAGPTEVRLYYRDGDPQGWIDFSFREGRLLIDDGKHRLAFGGLSGATMGVAPPRDGASPAFTLDLQFPGGRSGSIVAPFGAYPFPLVGD